MRPRTAAVVLTVALCLLLSPAARTAPRPSEAVIDWEFHFEFDDLQAIKVQVPGEAKPRLFWYLQYTVTNRTGQDRTLIPSIAMYTESGQLTRDGQGVPVYVFDHVKKSLNRPLLRDVTGLVGKLLQGEDNAKEGAAIWPDFDSAAGKVDIFIGGLSGETVRIKLPAKVTVKEMGIMGKMTEVVKDSILLIKTLQLTYSIPGEVANRLDAPVKLVEEQWIMR